MGAYWLFVVFVFLKTEDYCILRSQVSVQNVLVSESLIRKTCVNLFMEIHLPNHPMQYVVSIVANPLHEGSGENSAATLH